MNRFFNETGDEKRRLKKYTDYRKRTMIYIYLLSNLCFVGLLIHFTFKGESNTRFLIKIMTSLHFVLLALFAVYHYDLENLYLVMGLILSFFGDLALGLKHKSKHALKLGLLFFMSTQIFYIYAFGVTALSLLLWFPILIIGGFLVMKIRKDKHYDFKNLGLGVIMYACLLSLMMSTALAQWDLTLLSASFLGAIGSIFFLSSDFLLLHLYFYDHKKTNLVIMYLILYHVGQNCLAFSLFIK